MSVSEGDKEVEVCVNKIGETTLRLAVGVISSAASSRGVYTEHAHTFTHTVHTVASTYILCVFVFVLHSCVYIQYFYVCMCVRVCVCVCACVCACV